MSLLVVEPTYFRDGMAEREQGGRYGARARARDEVKPFSEAEVRLPGLLTKQLLDSSEHLD